ncbi:hypothetical protein BLNAU_11761 [Blattamonas nauphoetae]|uniref:Transmembrane protein n=1 Tax=Blattamonas nauphoetae TaxID=2049346 RepID=A0ABQ9XPM5_9EUKA|nr:hypothetical protein BLNAU_11761 [Blattamonas nauphoetae]
MDETEPLTSGPYQSSSINTPLEEPGTVIDGQSVQPKHDPWINRAIINRFHKKSLKTTSFWGWIMSMLAMLSLIVGSIVSWCIYHKAYQIILPIFSLILAFVIALYELEIMSMSMFGQTRSSQFLFSYYTRSLIYLLLAVPGFIVFPTIPGSALTVITCILYVCAGCFGETIYGGNAFTDIF